MSVGKYVRRFLGMTALTTVVLGGYTGALKAPVRCSGNHLSGYREALFQM